MNFIHDRRAFLRALAAGAAWAAADLGQVEEALAYAQQQAGGAAPAQPTALTRAQLDAVNAICSRILPSVDGRPGAAEAGAAIFIDRSLATFNAAQKRTYVDGIADLNRRAQAKRGGASFAALPPAGQDEILKDIERTPFFQAVRVDTIAGTLALPTWGGNRDYMGWHLLDIEHQMSFQAPFGYYDAEVNRRN